MHADVVGLSVLSLRMRTDLIVSAATAWRELRNWSSRVRRAADCVGVSIQLEKRNVAVGRGTTNLAAYEAILRRRQERWKFTFEAFNTAKAHFAEAVSLDASFARAFRTGKSLLVSLDVSGMRAARGICRW